MIDLKIQMQCFALLGKTRKQIQNWLANGEKSPGAVDAMRIRLERIILDIDVYLDELSEDDTDI